MRRLTRTKNATRALLCPLFNVCRRIRLTHASATFQQLTDNEITPARNSAAVLRLTPPVGTSGICGSGPAPLLCAGVKFRRRPSTIRELNNVALEVDALTVDHLLQFEAGFDFGCPCVADEFQIIVA